MKKSLSVFMLITGNLFARAAERVSILVFEMEVMDAGAPGGN